MMSEENKILVVDKKGKGSKKFKESQYVVKEDQQYKFFVDLRYEKEILDTILKLLNNILTLFEFLRSLSFLIYY